MSNMTIHQIRHRRADAETAVSTILLNLCQETGLSVRDVRLRSTMVDVIGAREAKVISVDATIILEDI